MAMESELEAAVETTEVGRGQLDEVTGALESLITSLDNNGGLDTLIQHVCRHVLEVVPGTDMASVTVLRDGVPETAACTDERVYYLDADQYRLGVGPCLEAATTGQIVRGRVEDTRDQWPKFAENARAAGVGSYLAAPFTVDARHSGSLNLYGEQGHGYAEVDGALLELYLTAVAGALRENARYVAAQQLVGQLREALTSRATIDQAKGIVMALRGISADEAFEQLVRQSQHENVKVREIANRTVASTVGQA